MERKVGVFNAGLFALHICSTLSLGLLGSGIDAAALPPCTDGSVFGTLTPFYQAVLGDENHNGTLDPGETPSAYYDAMSQSMKDMVHCGADPARTAPDVVHYRQRPESLGGLVRDDGGRIIGRVYDHLDPVTGRFYLAVVLSGCYTDNAFGRAQANPTDAAYLSSVFWPGRPYPRLERRRGPAGRSLPLRGRRRDRGLRPRAAESACLSRRRWRGGTAPRPGGTWRCGRRSPIPTWRRQCRRRG